MYSCNVDYFLDNFIQVYQRLFEHSIRNTKLQLHQIFKRKLWPEIYFVASEICSSAIFILENNSFVSWYIYDWWNQSSKRLLHPPIHPPWSILFSNPNLILLFNLFTNVQLFCHFKLTLSFNFCPNVQLVKLFLELIHKLY